MTYAEMVAGAARRWSETEYTPYLPGCDAAALAGLQPQVPANELIDGWVSYRVHFTASIVPEGGMRLRRIDAASSVA